MSSGRDGRVGLHLAVDHQVGSSLEHEPGRPLDLLRPADARRCRSSRTKAWRLAVRLPKRRASSAVQMAMSASSSALGIDVDGRVGEEQDPLVDDHHEEAGDPRDVGPHADDLQGRPQRVSG